MTPRIEAIRQSLKRNTGLVVARRDMVELFAAYDALTAELSGWQAERQRRKTAAAPCRGCGMYMADEGEVT